MTHGSKSHSGCLALFVTVNGDELRRSNYRKIEAFILITVKMRLFKPVWLSCLVCTFFTLVLSFMFLLQNRFKSGIFKPI